MKREIKKTFTYSCRPSVKKKAAKQAKKEGLTLSQVIDAYLEAYGSPLVAKFLPEGQGDC